MMSSLTLPGFPLFFPLMLSLNGEQWTAGEGQGAEALPFSVTVIHLMT